MADPGETTMNLREAQAALLSLGHELGKTGPAGNGVDGAWGKTSRTACAAFQRERGLAATGNLTAGTFHALRAAVAERAGSRIGLLTPAIIRAVAPKARQDIIDVLVAGADRFAAAGIARPLRLAHFLSQSATETAGFTALEENLNYSVDGLMATFSRARISAAQCQALGRKAGRAARREEIANIVYGGAFGRRNLGNTQAGDGWRFRGSGLLQTTGRANMRRAGFEANPEALRQPSGALAAALTFWSDNDLNRLADAGPVAPLRKRVNGGANGLAEAEAYFAKARRTLGI